MKPLLLTFFLFTSILFLDIKILPAQSLENISVAIETANARELSRYFDNNVEVTIVNNEGMYSKAQAELIVKDFFSKNPPSSFRIIHQGSSDRGSMYGIGTLITPQKSFRTYLYVKENNGGFLIQQIRFEED
jgi:hypothetical protein